MLTIRLSRTGRTNWPFYRIIVQEKTSAPSSRALDIIGSYDPKTEPATVKTDQSKLDHWIKMGARPSLAVAELFVKQDLLKLEQVPELIRERARRVASQKRVAEKKDWRQQVAKEKKKRAAAKQKATAKPAPANNKTAKKDEPEQKKTEDKTSSDKPNSADNTDNKADNDSQAKK